MSTVACYISGHGFGHAVRVIEVLRTLRLRRPQIALIVRTPLPRWFFEFNLQGEFRHGTCQLDVGVIQADSLLVDPEASLRAYAQIAAQRDLLVAAEVAAIAPHRPALVFADIPPLAFDVAAGLGIPAVAMTNFSWDWIYADYLQEFPDYAGMVADMRASYGRAALLLRLPMHGDLSAFPCIRDIPLVTRRATLDAAEVRSRLHLPAGERLVLLSFGGIGVTLAPPPAPPPGVSFITTESSLAGSPPAPHCRLIDRSHMVRTQVRYEDLVGTCDAVMTKPGYGIVAECVANGTPMVYTSRGRFAEYPCLVEGIQAHLPHAFISNEDLRGGRWNTALDAVLAQPRRALTVDVNGAAIAADALLEFIGY